MSRFLFPVPLLLIALVAGWLLWARTRRVVLGKSLVALGIGMLATISCGPVADVVLGTLEEQYSILPQVPADVTDIVVLGGGTDYIEGAPPSTNLTDAARSRVMEGVRLARTGDNGVRLIFTGYAGNGPVSVARLGADTAEMLGIDAERISVLESPRNTREEALAVAELLGDRPFVLVTSASHMPRAMKTFQMAGTNPIAAPAGFLARRAQYARSPWDWFPNATAIANTERAVYEYLGLAWLGVRCQVSGVSGEGQVASGE